MKNRKKRGRAQASVEYLMVAGLAFLIIVPMIYIFYDYTSKTSEEVTISKASRIANDLVDTAEQFYYLGEPSKTTVKFDMPPGVSDALVSPDQREFIFKLGDVYKTKEAVAYSTVNLVSYLVPQDLVAGPRSYFVEAKQDYAVIYTGNLSYAKIRWCGYYIARQIIDNAAVVYNDGISRAVELRIPEECGVNDISISFDNRKVTVTLDVDGAPADFTVDSPVPVREQNDGVIVTSTHTYDFLFTPDTPDYVLIDEPACRDNDRDGFGYVLGSAMCGYDCDDNKGDDPSGCPGDKTLCTGANSKCAICIYPGGPEYCGDGIDNNCDGIADSGFTLGEPCYVGEGICRKEGKYACINSIQQCDAIPGIPEPELCDDLDNDCDSSIDEDFPNKDKSCTVGLGACQRTGIYICKADKTVLECNVAAGTPKKEVCRDGIDNDCDGFADCSDPDCQKSYPLLISSKGETSGTSIAWNPAREEYGLVWYSSVIPAGLYFARIDANGNKMDIGNDGDPANDDVLIASTAYGSDSTYISASFFSIVWTGSEYGVAWYDSRIGVNKEVYFARINADGVKQGTDTRVTTAAGDSRHPSLAWNSADNEYGIAWEDYRDNNWEIYFARINQQGTKIDGDVRITNNLSNSLVPSIAWNSADNEYGIAWEDYRDNNYEIYFARVSAGAKVDIIGDVDNDIRITNNGGYDHKPSLVWTGSQYAVAWEGYNSFYLKTYIYFADISRDGYKIRDDLKVSDNSASSPGYASLAWNPDIGGGEYSVAWRDYIATNYEIYLARINSEGTAKIGGDIRITNDAGTSVYPSIAWNGREYGLVWQDTISAVKGLYYSKLMPEICGDNLDNQCSGSVGYGTVDEGCDDDDDDYCSSNMVRAIPYYCDEAVNNNCCNLGGNDCNDKNILIFPGNTNPYCDCNIIDNGIDQGTKEICNDGIDNDCDGLADCMDTDCINVATIRTITRTPSTSSRPSLAWDPSNNRYGVVWEYNSQEIDFSLFDARGNIINLNDASYIKVAGVSSSYTFRSSLIWNPDYQEYGIAWFDYTNSNQDIYLTRIDANGKKIDVNGDGVLDAGDDIRITTDPESSYEPSLVWNSASKEYGVAWWDRRNGAANFEIYFARINPATGKIGADVRVTDAAGDSRGVSLAWNSNNNEYGIAWYDQRDYISLNPPRSEIYFARIDANGNKIDIGNDGDPLNDDINVTRMDYTYSYSPSIAWDSTNKEYGIVWSDSRDDITATGNTEIYFTKLNADGTKILSDVRITNAAAASEYPFIVWNSNNNEYGIAWEDNRDSNMEIYFARINQQGTKIDGDVRITNAAGESRFPVIAWNGGEYGIAWRDYIASQNGIFFATKIPESCDKNDNDCDSIIDNNPGGVAYSLSQSCYDGPGLTAGVGICTIGTQACAAAGWGACAGEQLPRPKDCFSYLDNDCDGVGDMSGAIKQVTDGGSERYPEIYNNILVWQHDTGTSYEVYMCDLSSNGMDGGCLKDDIKTKIEITTLRQYPGPMPSIYDNLIVWTNGITVSSSDLYMCDLTKNNQPGGCLPADAKTRITQDASYKLNSRIYGNIIVWRQAAGYNQLFMCDLTKNNQPGGCLPADTKTQITTSLGNKEFGIHGNKIVWGNDNNYMLEMCDLTKNGQTGGCFSGDIKTQMTASLQARSTPHPVVYTNDIVWIGWDYNLHRYNLGADGIKGTADDGGETLITNEPSPGILKYSIAIYNPKIVWAGGSNRNIYVYDLLARTTTQLKIGGSDVGGGELAIYGNNMAWTNIISPINIWMMQC